jgi:gliding motility-associated-like protein
MPQLTKGHDYLLLLSHFTTLRPGDKGYKLSFGGGTAVITDTTQPHLKTIEANCGGDVLRVKLNKNIKCSSIAQDGSDFTFNSPDVTITGISGINCGVKFDTDSLILQLSKPLAPGTYTLGINKGGDGNTLLDYCDNAVPLTDALQIIITPKQPTPMDSMVPVTCAPEQVRLIFQKPIRCASLAPDGSDFAVSGTYPVQVVAVEGTCTDDLAKEILVTLNAPLKQTGSFRLMLQRGTDGNTLVDECGLETPAGSSLSFSVKDTVNATFTYTVKYGCERDTIAVFHNGANSVTSWKWDLDDQKRSTTQSAQGIYTVFEEKILTLVVSNGFCSDSASQAVMLDNFLNVDFTAFEDNCPNEPVTFTGSAQGKVKTHFWEFGDGGTAKTQITPYTFRVPDRQRTYQVKYTVTDSFGCQKAMAKPITIYPSCFIAVPTAFTPNGDGLNDFLAPLNAIKATNLEFRVYNRWGQLLYAATDWKQGWNGTFKGQPQPTATYVWMLRYTHRETGNKLEQKGTVVLIR